MSVVCGFHVVVVVFCVQHGADFTAENGLLDVALGGHFVQSTDVTTELSDFLSKLPDWMVAIGWVATYESWIV